VTAPVQVVPYADHRALLSRHAEACRLLDAIEMFSPMNLAALVDRLDEILSQIDTRLGHLEKRLDDAAVKDLPDGVPDDETDRYFTLPVLGGPEPITYRVSA